MMTREENESPLWNDEAKPLGRYAKRCLTLCLGAERVSKAVYLRQSQRNFRLPRRKPKALLLYLLGPRARGGVAGRL